MNSDESNQLCLKCGLCCNGVIFADVRLQPGDNAERLRALALRLTATRSRKGNSSGRSANAQPVWKLKQPCDALEECRCRIYSNRPDHCRRFECALLKKVHRGERTGAEALRIIRSARRRVAGVKRLLVKSGDQDETVPLKKRFQKLQARLESGTANAEAATHFSELTLAVHDLNLILSREFYPGDAQSLFEK